MKGLFFNQIIRISFEAYIEFYLQGMMNLYTAEYKLSGELLGITLTFFVLFMIFAVLPTLCLYILFINIQYLEKKSVRGCIGEIYEGLKIKLKFQRAYNLVFLLRRFIYLTIMTYLTDEKNTII